jgi:hypothetical protein
MYTARHPFHPHQNMLLESWRVRSKTGLCIDSVFLACWMIRTHVANIMRAERDHHYSAAMLHLLLQGPTLVHYDVWRTHRLWSCCGVGVAVARTTLIVKSTHTQTQNCIIAACT